MNFAFIHRRLLKQRRFRELIFICIILAVLVGILIVPIERSAVGATIKNTSDGLWWSIQTLTTVGYGDVAPVTDTGRVLGVVMQILGAILFGALIAVISSTMGRSQEEFYWNRLFTRLDKLETRIDEIERRTGFLVKGEVGPLPKHKD